MQELNDGDGQQALDVNQLIRRLQYAVKNGCAISPGTNDLTVQVAAGAAVFDGSAISVSAQNNVSLAAADPDDPRKDVVYLDGNGTLRVATGIPEPAQPSDQIRRATYRPAPPDLSATDAVVLAEVWVPAGANDIVADDISDRRLFADAAFRDVTADSINTDEAVTDTIRNDGFDKGLKIDSVTINNDDATSVDSTAYSFVFISAISEERGVGQFTTDFSTITTVNKSNISNEGNTVLSGTTGPDGTLNVSIDANTLYLENRTGTNPADFTVFQIGV